jgi:hypothetical protein
MADGPRLGVLWLLVVVVGVVGVRLVLPSLRAKPPTERAIRRDLLRELQPVTLKNCTIERFGGPYDGGYLMCGNLLANVRSAYSYGIGTDDNWGCQISRQLRVPVHEYDCFNPLQPACPGGQPLFHNECIASTSATIESRVFDSLSNQIKKNGDVGKTLALKIDVEGAEVDSLLDTPASVLNRIDQLTMEVHGTDQKYLEMIRKLKRTFHVVHLHFNNHVCTDQHSPLPASAYQVSFVNKRIAEVDPAAPKPTLPHPLDAPDLVGERDCQASAVLGR